VTLGGERSFFSIFVDDPRWEAGAVLAGVGAVLALQGTSGEITVLDYIAGGIGLAGLLLVALSIRHAAVSARVARAGASGCGRVAGIARLWPTRSYALRYRFRDNSGAEFEGRIFLSQNDAFDWRAGDEGEVRFDSGDSSKSVWLGTSDFVRKPSTRPAAPSAANLRPTPRQPTTAPLPTRSTLRRRSRSMRHAFIIFLFFMFSVLALAAMTVGLVTGTSDDIGGYAIYALIVLSLAGAGLYKLSSGLREVAEKMRVLRNGVATEASVMSVEEQLLRGRAFSLSIGWIVSYSYDDRTGQTHYGDSGFLSEFEAGPWRTGDRGQVFFDPDKPSSSVWAA
jgi:uncharacterized membrane protein